MLRIPTIKYHALERVFHAFVYAFFILCLWLPGQQAVAAVPTPDEEDFVDIDGTNNNAPDVPSVLIRNWYTSPDKKPFFSNRFRILQGWSVLGFWSPQYSMSPGSYSSFNGIGVGAGLQKDLSKSYALRLSGAYMKADIPASTAQVDRYMGSADLLWNFSNHWFGYDPARSIEALLVAGGTFGVVKSDGLSSHKVWQGQLGVQIRKTLSPHLSAFLEPYYYVSDSDYDYYQNGADYDDGFGLKTGILVRLTDPLRETPWFEAWANPRWFDNWYIQNLGGINFGKEDGLTALHTLSDYNFSVNLGHWVAPSWGFQVGMSDRQILFQNSKNRRQTVGRMEGILNLVSLWDNVSVKRLGLTISGGAELGLERKYSTTTGKVWPRTDHLYKGLTGAAQLKYFFSSNSALVAEGRYSTQGDGKSIITPSIGVEMYRSKAKAYRFWRNSAQTRFDEMVENGEGGNMFLHDWNVFIETGVGFDKTSNNSRPNALSVAPMAEGALGLRINHLHSVRLKGRLVYHSYDAAAGNSYYYINGSLDYMFDLTKLWTGVDPHYRYSMRPFVGGVFVKDHLASATFSKVSSNNDFGGIFGIQNAFRINSNLELYVEPYYTAVKKGYNHWSLSAGAIYTIERASQREALFAQGDTDRSSHFYVQAMGGVQLASRLRFSSSDHRGAFDLTLGRTIFRNLALQGSFTQQIATPNYMRERTHRLYGVRGELVAEALRILWPQSYELGWAWTVQGGWDILRNAYVHSLYHGPTIASQVRYRIGQSPVWLAVQARMQMHLCRSGKGNGKEAIWSGLAGLHYELPAFRNWRNGSNGNFGSIYMGNPYDNIKARYLNSLSVAAYGSWLDAAKYGYGASIGYDFTPIHGVRINYDHASSSLTKHGEEVNLNAFSIDYMLDITNLSLKPKANPNDDDDDVKTGLKRASFISRLSVRPFVGIYYGIHHAENGERLYDTETKSYYYTPKTDYNLGVQTGLNAFYRVNRHIGIFIEQRALFTPFDPYLSPNSHYDWHMLSNAGLKVNF